MLREFPSGNLLRKHNVEFLKGAILGLGKTEPCPNSREETEGTPEEGSFTSPVPGSGVHHMWLENTADDVPDVVGASAKDDSLGADLCGSNFSDDGVDNWADGHGVCTEPDEAEDGLNVFDGCSLVYAGEDGDEIERCYQDAEANKED